MKEKLNKRIEVCLIMVSVFPLLFFLFPGYVYAASSQIRITEIMYDPSGNGDREFLEIYNGSDTTANLSGMTLFGVDYTFPGGTTLGSGQYGVIVRNLSVFKANNPGARIFGQYGGKLRGGGELISIRKNGVVQTQVSYSYGGAWPSSPKDGGPSLSLVRTNANESQAGCWAASATSGGTPGSANNPAGGGGGCETVMYPVVASSSTNENDSQSSVSGQPTSNSDQESSSVQSHEEGDSPEELTEEEKLQEQAKQEAAVAEEASKQIAEDSATRRNQTRKNIIIALLLMGVTVGGSSVYLLYRHTRFRVEQSKLLKGSKKHHGKHKQKS